MEKDGGGGGQKLKAEYSKIEALNKVGHGIHVIDDVFSEYCDS